MTPLESTVKQLQDRDAIHAVLYGYCRNADLLDADGMAAYFVEDCEVAYVMPNVAPAFKGKAELVRFLREYFPKSVSSTHFITNVELVFDTPAQVTAHTYMYSWQRFKEFPAASDCHRWGRYEIRLVDTPAGWRMSHLRLISAGEYGGTRVGEQFGRPWPPQF